jgi:hypothetical protein
MCVLKASKYKLIFLLSALVLYHNVLFPQENIENNFIKFDQKKWNQIRERVDNNLPLYEEEKSTQVVSKPPVVTPTTIEFIEGTQLSIAGRKLIGVELNSVQYPYKPGYSRTDVNMKQELQVTVKGKVGKNVDVNIDIDDTQPDKRDISIIYRGEGVDAGPGAVGYKAKPGAFIQEAAFGDIQLSLPNTEFVGYSRQVFGLKVIGQYNKARMYLIASQSKGNFETKRFTGKTEFERKILSDTSYIRRKYYRIAFGNYKVKKDSVKVYLDTLDPQRDPITLTEFIAQAFNISTFTYSGKFELLALGKDYVVDYSTGIITFLRPIQQNWVIAVDYIDENSGLSLRDLVGTTNYILIKDKDETPNVTTELLNRYYIGRTNIIRDDGAGNFLLKIVDKSGRILNSEIDKIQPGDKNLPVYKTGNIGDIKVDFENGLIYFDQDKPFAEDCYYKTPISRYDILVEYRYKSKTYFLKPFIVPYSERVVVDGKLLQRNIDYWLDYDSGILTFFREEDIKENSMIEVNYEYSMLGLQGGDTILGSRIELPLSNKLFVGSSWISNLPSKGSSVPDIRTTPSSLQVWETDAKINSVKIPLIPLQINSISLEYAENEKNPNIWDKAVVENMEGITLEDSVSTYRHMWYYSSCSNVYIPGSYNDKTDKLIGGELNWENEDVPVKEINPNKQTTYDKQQVLKINYNLETSSEVAMAYMFSKYGLDFSKKLYLEIEYYSDGGGGELYLDLGHMSEDIDNDNILDTEDKNSNGRLDYDEDTGFEYNGIDKKYYIGKSNGRLDTEDVDGDGFFHKEDICVYKNKISDLNFTGWVSTIVPLSVTETDRKLWSSVKEVRLRIKGKGKKGVIKIAKISVVGNKFETTTPYNTKIYAVNNENDLSYTKLSELEEYTSIYGTQYKEKTVEQALAVKYNFDTIYSSSVITLLYSRGQDFTSHHKLNFFLFNKTGSEIIFKLRTYTDQNNYLEFSTHTAKWINEWKKFVIEQIDSNNDNIPDGWVIPESSVVGGICYKYGLPNLQGITKIEFIIENPSHIAAQEGVIYINDVYLSESWKRKGVARKIDLSFSIPNWINFGGYARAVDRKFETFTSAITNQDNLSINGFFDFVKLKFMPISFKGRQEQTVTPSALKSGEFVSTLEEGKKVYTESSFNTSINIQNLPQITLNYSKSVSSTTALARTDVKDSYQTTISYHNPLSKYIPLNSVSLSYGEEKFLLYPWSVEISTSQPTIDNTKSIGIYLPFNFWNKLNSDIKLTTKNTFSEKRLFFKKLDEELVIPQFKPSKDIFDYYTKLTFFALYNLPKTYQLYYSTDSIVTDSYEKRKEYNVELNSSINLLKFFSPNVSYRMSIYEDFNFPISDKKDIIRNASGNFSVNFTPKDILNIKPIQSLRLYYTFNLTSGDKYEKLPKEEKYIDIYSFKNIDLFWYKTEVSTITELRKSMLERKEQRITSSWKIFEGLPLKENLSFLTKTDLNLSYSDSIEEREETLSKFVVYTKMWPDIVSTIYDLENIIKLFVKQDIIKNTKLDLSYSYKTVETKKVSMEQNIKHKEVTSFNLFDKYQIVSSFEKNYSDTYNFLSSTHPIRTLMTTTDIFDFQISFPFFGQRLTPKYELRKDYAEDARGLSTKNITTHSLILSYYADITPQQGLNLFGKVITLQNRLRINSNLSYTRKESPIDITYNNTDSISFNTRGDYDVSKYINISVSLGTDVNINRVVKTETNYKFSLQGQVIIRF